MKKLIFTLLIVFSILSCRLFHLYEDDFASADDSTTTINITDTTTTTVGPVVAYDIFYKDTSGDRIDLTNDSIVDFGVNSLLSLKVININVVNTGTIDLSFDVNIKLYDNSTDFTIVQNPTPSLIPGATNTISVEFKFKSKGIKIAGIDLTAENGSKKYITLDLKGECNGNGPLFVSSATGDDQSGDGSMDKPYKTISYGINKYIETANRYGVCVSAGLYEESIGINSKVNLKGGFAVVEGVPDYFNSKPTDRENSSYKTEIKSSGDYVIMVNGETSIPLIDRTMLIEGFVISNTGGLTSSCGIYLTKASPTISNCTINGGGFGTESSTSILIDNTSDPALSSNIIKNNLSSKSVYTTAVKVIGNSNCLFGNNAIDLGSASNPNSYIMGIWLDNSSASISNSKIWTETPTTASDVTSCGIYLENIVSKVDILNNQILGGWTDAVTGTAYGIGCRNSTGIITINGGNLVGGVGTRVYGIALDNCLNYNIFNFNGLNSIKGGDGKIYSVGIELNNSNGKGKISSNTIFGDLYAQNSYGIHIYNSNPYIDNNYIQMNDGSNVNSIGIFAQNSANFINILNNFIKGGKAIFSVGIYIDRSLVEIKNNDNIFGGEGKSITGESSNTFGMFLNSIIGGSIIERNFISGGMNGSQNTGIYLTGAISDINISQNEIYGSIFDSSGAVGVLIDTYTDSNYQTDKSALLSNNFIIGAKSYEKISNSCAMLLGGNSKPKIYNNDLIASVSHSDDNTGDNMVGILLKDQCAPEIINNLIFNVGKGLSCGIFEATADATPSLLKNNNIFDLKDLYRDSSGLYITSITEVNDFNKILQGTNGVTMNNISINMVKMEYFYNDLTNWNLNYNPPIDITAGGFDLSDVTVDKFERPRTSPYSIGAFELDK